VPVEGVPTTVYAIWSTNVRRSPARQDSWHIALGFGSGSRGQHWIWTQQSKSTTRGRRSVTTRAVVATSLR